MSFPTIGALALLHSDRHRGRTDISVRVVRSLDDLQRVATLRALTYMAEQDCPYDEEFDGNDLCAMHLLAFEGREPAGTLRIRFFEGFCKIERVCVDARRRGGAIFNHLLAHAVEIASRKGYRRALAYIQARLEGTWDHVIQSFVVNRDTPFHFSNCSYLTLEIPIPEHPDAIRFDADPYVMLRPEGDWDVPGILDPPDQREIPAAA